LILFSEKKADKIGDPPKIAFVSFFDN